jgi:glycosyltransferase involved in cell wall biosynthesis
VVGGFFDTGSRSNFESRMASLKNVRYMGPLNHQDVTRILARSRVLANTSAWEGFPNTMLEAWSLGVPVVSLLANPGGVISRERLGLVSGIQNQMASDISRLVEERSLNLEMGENGLKYVRKVHSLDAVCQAIGQVVPGFYVQNDDSREVVAT